MSPKSSGRNADSFKEDSDFTLQSIHDSKEGDPRFLSPLEPREKENPAHGSTYHKQASINSKYSKQSSFLSNKGKKGLFKRQLTMPAKPRDGSVGS